MATPKKSRPIKMAEKDPKKRVVRFAVPEDEQEGKLATNVYLNKVEFKKQFGMEPDAAPSVTVTITVP